MKVLLCVFLFFIFTPITFADNKVLINEFSVEPNQIVELYNTDANPIDISNWYIDDSGGTTFYTIPSNTLLSPSTCLIFQSDFNLNKSSSDIVRLFDTTANPTSSSAHLIDSFSYKLSPGMNMSFFRNPDASLNWSSGSATLGKFNTTNESCVYAFTPTPLSEPTPTNTPSYNNIYISEIMAAPGTGEHEWIELYNDNDFDVTLSNWYLDDGESTGSSPKIFSTFIPSHGYQAIDLLSSVFNDSGDTVRLLDSVLSEKDSIEYKNAKKGISFSRTDFTSDVFCSTDPTQNLPNNVCDVTPPPTPTPLITITTVPMNKPIPSLSPPHSSFISTIDVSPQIKNGSTRNEVLGTSTKKYHHPNEKIIKSLVFCSIGYSLLTISGVMIRMKKERYLYG